MGLHREIKEVEKQVLRDNPELKLRLHAYVLSVTPPDQIGAGLRSREEWSGKGLYFLKDPKWPQQILEDALQQGTGSTGAARRN